MRHRVFLILLLIFNVFLFSQDIEKQNISDEHEFLWPVQGKYPGENVFMSPTDQIFNSYFKKWQPFMGYIIGGDVGDPVVAVEDGVIFHIAYSYSDEYLRSWSTDSVEEMTEFIGHRDNYDPKWVNIFIGLEIAPGKRVWYTGLSPDHLTGLKEGDRVKRGDIIGAIGYNYRFHEKPGLEISYDEKGRSSDVEKKLLGTDNKLFSSRRSLIKSNYKSKRHSIEELHNSLDILYKTLKEIHPSLYRFIEEEEFEGLYQSSYNSIDRPLTSDEFFKIINPIIQSIRDNHTYLQREYYSNDFYLYEPKSDLPITLTVFDDRCYILDDPLGELEKGLEIVEISGESIGDIVSDIKLLTPIASGDIKTYQNEVLKYDFNDYYIWEKGFNPGEAIKLKSIDGDIIYRTLTEKRENTEELDPKDVYSFQHISKDIVLFKVNGMSLTEVDRESISNYFITHKLWKSQVILDLRGNPGGNIMDTYFLYSLFNNKLFTPFKKQIVNSNSTYDSLEYSTNYSNDFELYRSFSQRESDGRYSISSESHPELFSTIEISDKNFSGDLYVLTDGFTGSAATVLASLFRYHGNGEVVGREGSGNFYSMNGIDFAKIMLGKTGIVLNIPMVQVIYNYEIVGEIPQSRGVIPNLIVDQNLEEFLSGRDVVLEVITNRIERELFIERVTVITILALFVISFSVLTIYLKRRRVLNKVYQREKTTA